MCFHYREVIIIIWIKGVIILCFPTDGYISNTCVDIDYEEVKRKFQMSRKVDTSPLPPPPPDPPQMLNMESYNKTR